MGDIWMPGAAGPLDELVARIVVRIQAFVEEHGTQARVEVELRDGPATVLRSLSAEPGYGFLTLLPHGEDGGEEEWIVPVAAVARITLRQAEEREPVGFSLPGPSRSPSRRSGRAPCPSRGCSCRTSRRSPRRSAPSRCA
jgi:hypothetical protein